MAVARMNRRLRKARRAVFCVKSICNLIDLCIADVSNCGNAIRSWLLAFYVDSPLLTV